MFVLTSFSCWTGLWAHGGREAPNKRWGEVTVNALLDATRDRKGLIARSRNITSYLAEKIYIIDLSTELILCLADKVV